MLVLLQLKGLVDFDAEVVKLEAQLVSKVQPAIETLQAREASPDYTSKVPEAVREANAKKLEELLIQKDGLQKAIANFKTMQS